jgi:hypothetical protein
MIVRNVTIWLGAAAIVVAAFFITNAVLNYWSGSIGPSSDGGNVLAGKMIVTSGDAITSTSTLQNDTSLRFKGKGFARIVGTSGLKCLTNKCSFSAAITFASATPDKYEVIFGQSYNGERGWHLLWIPGQLYLQPDGGDSNQIVVPFTPKPDQEYTIQLVNSSRGATMSIDGKVVGASNHSPMTDIARDITVGGRDGSSTNGFAGGVSDLRMSTAE